MKVEELRIGNLVRDKVSKTELKVIELTEKDIITYVIDRDMFPLKDGWGIEPIPLTEESLVKFGAKKEKDICVHDRFILSYKEAYNFWYVTNLDGVYMTKIEFVHEWQNFYLFANGQELIIKK